MTLSTQDVTTRTTMNEDGTSVEIRSDFICPITLQVMNNPLMTRTGFNFERAAILSWLDQGSGSCPLTREPLTTSDLISNRRLATQIRFWRQRNGIPEPTREETGVAECEFVGFLKISGDKNDEIMARHSQPTLSLASLHTQILPTRPLPSRSAAPRRTGRSRYERQSREPRRNFLRRILTSGVNEVDAL
jgi:hypothetical protein